LVELGLQRYKYFFELCKSEGKMWFLTF